MKKRKISQEQRDNLQMMVDLLPDAISEKLNNRTIKQVFSVLYDFSQMNKHEQFTVGYKTLEKLLGKTAKTIYRSITSLEKIGFIKIIPGHKGMNTAFLVTVSDDGDIIQRDFKYSTDGSLILKMSTYPKDNSDTKCPPIVEDKMSTKMSTKEEAVYKVDNEGDTKEMSTYVGEGLENPNVHLIYNNIKYNNKNLINKIITLIDNNLIDKNLKENIFNCLVSLVEEKETKNNDLNFDKMNEEIEVLKDLVSKQQKHIEVLEESLNKVNERLNKQARVFIEMKSKVDSLESGNVTSTVGNTQSVTNTNPIQKETNFNSSELDEGKQCWITLMKAKDIITSTEESYERKQEAKKTIKKCINSGLLRKEGVEIAEKLLKTFKEEEYKMKLQFYKEAKVALDNQVLSNEEKYKIATTALQYQGELHTAHKIDKYTLVRLAKELDVKSSVFESPHSLVSPITKFVDSYELANNKKIAV